MALMVALGQEEGEAIGVGLPVAVDVAQREGWAEVVG